MKKELQNIFNNKEDVITKRKEFWNTITKEQLENLSNKELYEIFESKYPWDDEFTTKFDWVSFNRGLNNLGIKYESKNKKIVAENNAIKKSIINNVDKKITLICDA